MIQHAVRCGGDRGLMMGGRVQFSVLSVRLGEHGIYRDDTSFVEHLNGGLLNDGQRAPTKKTGTCQAPRVFDMFRTYALRITSTALRVSYSVMVRSTAD